MPFLLPNQQCQSTAQGVQSIVISVSVYVYICMSVCLSARISKKWHFLTSWNFLYMLTVARSSSDDNALPVLWTTSCLAIIGQATAVPTGHVLKITHQAAAPLVQCDTYTSLVFCLPSHFSTAAVGSTKSPKRISTDSWNRYLQAECLPVAQPTTSKQCSIQQRTGD